MGSRLFTMLSVLSLLLCMAIAVMWLRSSRHDEGIFADYKNDHWQVHFDPSLLYFQHIHAYTGDFHLLPHLGAWSFNVDAAQRRDSLAFSVVKWRFANFGWVSNKSDFPTWERGFFLPDWF